MDDDDSGTRENQIATISALRKQARGAPYWNQLKGVLQGFHPFAEWRVDQFAETDSGFMLAATHVPTGRTERVEAGDLRRQRKGKE